MKAYCESDIKLLKAGCRKFRKEFKQHVNFDPVEKCVTIVSACNRYWRKKLIPQNTIASKPRRGWLGSCSNQSVKALKWLAWHERQLPHTSGDRIRTALNGGERRVGPQRVLVDGYDERDPVTQRPTVYEFHGCLWHGCPKCFKNRHSHSSVPPDGTLHEVYECTLEKIKKLKDQGYRVIEKWECEWDKDVKTDPELQQFLVDFEIVDPLQPRDAFFGGRTNAVKLHHKIDTAQEEQIKYMDVTSLYPWVNKTGEYPVGHPDILVNPTDQDIRNYIGMAKVDVLPAYELYNPVLPYRHQGKLTFPLCRSCVEQEMPKPLLERSHCCSHTLEQRTLRGTWCTPELVKAVEQGYEIKRIHEVWNFPPEQRKTGFFAQYVNTWLKIKQESAGYPGNVTTPEQKADYVRNYKQKENISLNPSSIAKNPGRKATAKLMLNSFWGKFGENLHKPTTQCIHTAAGLFDIVSNELLDIRQIRICNEESLEIVYQNLKENEPDNGRVNIFMAAFTTCHARLKLYEHLEKLQHQVLYFDTDSVVYSHQPGQPDITQGNYLGEMTDELEGDHIVEFTSAGPKNYGYVTNAEKKCCKVRGFTLNVRGSRQLNYDFMRQNLLDEIQDPQDERRNVDVTDPNFFMCDSHTKDIYVSSRTKRYSLVFDKRVADPVTFKSYPYGYTPTTLDNANMANVETLLEKNKKIMGARITRNAHMSRV